MSENFKIENRKIVPVETERSEDVYKALVKAIVEHIDGCFPDGDFRLKRSPVSRIRYLATAGLFDKVIDVEGRIHRKMEKRKRRCHRPAMYIVSYAFRGEEYGNIYRTMDYTVSDSGEMIQPLGYGGGPSAKITKTDWYTIGKDAFRSEYEAINHVRKCIEEKKNTEIKRHKKSMRNLERVIPNIVLW